MARKQLKREAQRAERSESRPDIHLAQVAIRSPLGSPRNAQNPPSHESR
jgi:hypothetical protein